VENSYIGPCSGEGIKIDGSSSNIEITGNYFEDIRTGVYVVQSQGINIHHNSFKNVQGPFPRGQCAQFNEVTGAGNRINCNICENVLGESYAEDAFNLYRSSGTSGDPIQIIGNKIKGGGPSKSGGGIMTGDNGGNYVIAKDNILVDPGQYGMAIASGKNIKIMNNKIYAKLQPFTNVGLYVWEQSGSECNSHEVRGNQVNWFRKDGSHNNAWNSGNCGTVVGWNDNDFGANIDESIWDIQTCADTGSPTPPPPPPPTPTLTPPPPLGEGLVAHWKFDEGSGTQAMDFSGNLNHGTVNGATWTTGKLIGALSFDGVDDYVETSYSNDLNHWTVSAWVKGNNPPSDKWDAGPVMKEENFLISWDHTSGNFRGAAGLRVGGAWHPASFGALDAGKWYHLTATYDGETLKAYKDGKLASSNTDPSGIADSSSYTIKIGRHAVRSEYFSGSIDDVRIFSRALSASEIQAIYNISSNPLKPLDLNNDNKIDILDIIIISNNFKKQNFVPEADINKDNIVNLFDFVRVARHFGVTLA